MVNCAVESANGRISPCCTDHLHELGNAIGVDLVLLEVSQDTRNAVQRTLFVDKLDACRVSNQFLVFASTAIFGEDVDLCNRFPRRNRHVLDVAQRSVVVKQICRVEKSDARQFIQDFFLPVPVSAIQLLATFVDIRQDVRSLHQQPRTAIDLLHLLVSVACGDIGSAAILIGICKQVITEAALLRRQSEFIRTRSRLSALGCCGVTGFSDCVQLT